MSRCLFMWLFLLFFPCLLPTPATAQHDHHQVEKTVELQPLTAQVKRLVEAMEYLGEPISPPDLQVLEKAFHDSNTARAQTQIQEVLDKYCLLEIHINPESRVKVDQGLTKPVLSEQGWRTYLVKVRNEAGVTAQLKAESPHALPVYARGNNDIKFSFDSRPQQTITAYDVANRWLDLSMYDKPPLRPQLSGLELEYRIIQLYSRDAGKREAKISFNVGQGTQDIGFRNDADILFTCQPSQEVKFQVLDEYGQPTTASFLIQDPQGRIYPSRAKRLAPDFNFHPQIYRAHGESIRLPAGEYNIKYTRGPEYIEKQQRLTVLPGQPQTINVRLERWIDPSKVGAAARPGTTRKGPSRPGWYSGDHHIHAAGCMHYESPTEGVLPQDMMRHILGEALHVGSVLTWGPGYYYQKQFFEAKDNALSTENTLMRYDLEVSGFPSSHSGHLVLLRLIEQNYPGTKVLEDWPTWDLPVLQWAKKQGAVVGFAHSGWGLEVKTSQLPHFDMPKFDGIGANEYIVDVTHDAVDFISTVDTPSVWELNIWYHTLNCGFRTRISGETDFPCIYGERVGLGRSYVQLDDQLNYDAWVEGIRQGRAYVSDGKSHLMDFQVNDLPVGTNGSELKLGKPAKVRVTARVAARLDEKPNEEIRKRSYDKQPYWDLERARKGDTREVPVEVVVNGKVVATKSIVADGTVRDIAFEVPIERSSWVALRILPSSHTNPVFITVNDKPVRASRKSADWCARAVDQCWGQKEPQIAAHEREAARKAYEHARHTYHQILAESEVD
ncbi:CehA/McbA family metallohydrolase [Telluribacter humicola]|uniref:CehA/McbA family metallohydrolase n=1 Tax=Telluribacter humicola TaxID=1720261 RepID=UPI001E5E174E|nr:CehA/McbA family metallohydrolase [Telluribacter humicola]